MGWATSRWHGWWDRKQVVVQEQRPGAQDMINNDAGVKGRAVDAPPPVIEGDHAAALTTRVSELEDRISRINVQAQAASGNAARAEGLLIAFAARRALDTGGPLGYIEGQLRLRFGRAQPRDVATIINAAREPVTLQDLQAGLVEIGPELTGRGPREKWWEDVKREEIGRAHVRTPVTNEHIVCRLLLAKTI